MCTWVNCSTCAALPLPSRFPFSRASPTCWRPAAACGPPRCAWTARKQRAQPRARSGVHLWRSWSRPRPWLAGLGWLHQARGLPAFAWQQARRNVRCPCDPCVPPRLACRPTHLHPTPARPPMQPGAQPARSHRDAGPPWPPRAGLLRLGPLHFGRLAAAAGLCCVQPGAHRRMGGGGPRWVTGMGGKGWQRGQLAQGQGVGQRGHSV